MSSGFISESVLEEKRRQRQAEWEKVRKADDPVKAPEEPVETRSLFEQLQANKQKAQEEWDEEHKFKNQIRGIDDDEAEFLDEIDSVKAKIERARSQEEKRELEEFRKSQEALLEKRLEERLKSELQGTSSNQKNVKSLAGGGGSKQSKLLLGAVKRKHSSSNASDDNTKKNEEPQTKKPLGALAGLGNEYNSSSEDDNDDDAKEKT